MITISRNEADMIRKRVPSARITRTVHHYYVEEDPRVLALLKKPARRGA